MKKICKTDFWATLVFIPHHIAGANVMKERVKILASRIIEDLDKEEDPRRCWCEQGKKYQSIQYVDSTPCAINFCPQCGKRLS
jgi:hypothetical protein